VRLVLLLKRTSDLWWLFTRQTVSVTREEKIIDAARLMTGRNFRHLPIVGKNSKIIGIISAQDIVDTLYLSLRPHSSPKEIENSLNLSVEKIMTPGIIAVEPGDGLGEIVKKIVHHNIGALPVVNETGIVQGIITLRDLISLIGMSSEPLHVLVSEVMNRKIITIGFDEPFFRAVELMSANRIRRLPVLGRNDELIGVITNKDVLGYVLESIRKSGWRGFGIQISEFMTKNVITVSQDDDIRVAASRMMIFGVGGLSIEDVPTGETALVTERDLVRTLSKRRSVEFLLDAMRQ
jgi:CBS domain-containing protein